MIKTLMLERETTHNRAFSLALSCALERAEAGAEIDEDTVKSEMAPSPL